MVEQWLKLRSDGKEIFDRYLEKRRKKKLLYNNDLVPSNTQLTTSFKKPVGLKTRNNCFQDLSKLQPELHLIPDTCPCGAGWKGTNSPKPKLTTIWDINCIVHGIPIEKLRCKAKVCSWSYQGIEDGLFNHSDLHVFSYTMLYSYLNNNISSNMAWFSFIESTKRTWRDCQGYSVEESNLDVRSFSTAFLNWTENVENDELPFNCIICGKYPKAMIFDGTDLGIAKKWALGQSLKSPSMPHSHDPRPVPWVQRVLIQNKTIRDEVELLLTAKGPVFSQQRENTLIKVKEALPELYPFLQQYCSSKEEMKKLPRIWKRFLKTITGTASLSSLVPFKHLPTLKKYLLNKRYEQEDLFSSEVPLLAELLSEFDAGTLPEHFIALMNVIVPIMEAPFKNHRDPDNNTAAPITEKEDIPAEDPLTSGNCWTGWNYQPLRQLKWYPYIDRESSTTSFEAEQHETDANCFKSSEDINKKKKNVRNQVSNYH